jgi:hypothetical protein
MNLEVLGPDRAPVLVRRYLPLEPLGRGGEYGNRKTYCKTFDADDAESAEKHGYFLWVLLTGARVCRTTQPTRESCFFLAFPCHLCETNFRELARTKTQSKTYHTDDADETEKHG